MSFGLLKHFKDHKKSFAENIRKSYSQHVIIGQDLAAVLKLMEIKHSHPTETVKLISSRPLTKQFLVESYESSVSLLRSQAAVEGIYRKYHNAKLYPHNKEASFYKDGKFHEFSGRAKSMELLPGEAYFMQKGYKVSVASLFQESDWENLDEVLSECVEVHIFQTIEKVTSAELIEKKEWLLTFKDFTEVDCENLYVSLPPKKFLNYLVHKEAVTPELIDVCSSSHVQGGLAVSWVLNKEIFTEDRTLFIPQSMTHEWGHFIVEFDSYNHTDKTQCCHVLFLIHEEEPQTEDLGSKIRLMKRVLDRVFPDLEKSIVNEYIRFDEEMLISDVKYSAMEQVGFDYPTLKFLGQMSPLVPQQSDEKFLARVLLN